MEQRILNNTDLFMALVKLNFTFIRVFITISVQFWYTVQPWFEASSVSKCDVRLWTQPTELELNFGLIFCGESFFFFFCKPRVKWEQYFSAANVWKWRSVWFLLNDAHVSVTNTAPSTGDWGENSSLRNNMTNLFCLKSQIHKRFGSALV